MPLFVLETRYCIFRCTGNANECEQSGVNVSPVVSGRISTRDKFSFKYGKIEIIAKLPVGSWLYPG